MIFIAKFFSHLLAKFVVLFKSEAMKFASRYKGVAAQIVLELAVSALEPAEKRRVAFDRITDRLKEQGRSYRDHWINLLIEITVTELKARKR